MTPFTTSTFHTQKACVYFGLNKPLSSSGWPRASPEKRGSPVSIISTFTQVKTLKTFSFHFFRRVQEGVCCCRACEAPTPGGSMLYTLSGVKSWAAQREACRSEDGSETLSQFYWSQCPEKIFQIDEMHEVYAGRGLHQSSRTKCGSKHLLTSSLALAQQFISVELPFQSIKQLTLLQHNTLVKPNVWGENWYQRVRDLLSFPSSHWGQTVN